MYLPTLDLNFYQIMLIQLTIIVTLSSNIFKCPTRKLKKKSHPQATAE